MLPGPQAFPACRGDRSGSERRSAQRRLRRCRAGGRRDSRWARPAPRALRMRRCRLQWGEVAALAAGVRIARHLPRLPAAAVTNANAAMPDRVRFEIPAVSACNLRARHWQAEAGIATPWTCDHTVRRIAPQIDWPAMVTGRLIGVGRRPHALFAQVRHVLGVLDSAAFVLGQVCRRPCDRDSCDFCDSCRACNLLCRRCRGCRRRNLGESALADQMREGHTAPPSSSSGLT